ncbi:MAG: hypothetical protein RLZZ608_583 [Actinomycetota bacterium]|jgi:hypothetical protein
MATSPEPTAPDSSASPYGPADGVEQLFGTTAEEPAAAAQPVVPAALAATPAWVDRGRRILTIATWITAALSVALTVFVVVFGLLNIDGAFDLLGEQTETVMWSSVFAAPVSFTIAMNLLVWRKMLPALSRRTRGEAIGIVIVVSLALAVVSVLIVVGLLLMGFFVGITFGSGSDL